jgi:hypothetical protein
MTDFNNIPGSPAVAIREALDHLKALNQIKPEEWFDRRDAFRDILFGWPNHGDTSYETALEAAFRGVDHINTEYAKQIFYEALRNGVPDKTNKVRGGRLSTTARKVVDALKS